MADLLTAGQVIEAVNLTAEPTPGSRDDNLIKLIAAAVGPVIEDITGPVSVGSVTISRTGGRTGYVLPSRPTSITSVSENGAATTDYFADLEAGIVYAGSRLSPRSFAAGEVTIVYATGSDTLAGNVKMAAYELCRHWWSVGQSANMPAWDNAPDDAPYVPSGFSVPRRVTQLLAANPRFPGFA